VIPRQWDDETRELLQPCVALSPWSLVEPAESVFAGSAVWELATESARAVVAVRATAWQGGGRLLEVVGARSLGDRFRAEQLQVIEQLAKVYDVDLLSMTTRHPHLVRGCERAGWTSVASVVVKPMKVQ
jgi:hypothetical protein